MRIPNPRLIRLGGVVGGSIVERGDGEQIISPLIYRNVEIPSPLNKNVPSLGGTFDDTFSVSSRLAQAGAVAGQALTICTFKKGLWKLYFVMQAQFTGTSDVTKFDTLQLNDPDGQQTAIITMTHLNGQSVFENIELPFVFQRDGFNVTQVTGTTIVGDNLANNIALVACREL